MRLNEADRRANVLVVDGEQGGGLLNDRSIDVKRARNVLLATAKVDLPPSELRHLAANIRGKAGTRWYPITSDIHDCDL